MTDKTSTYELRKDPAVWARVVESGILAYADKHGLISAMLVEWAVRAPFDLECETIAGSPDGDGRATLTVTNRCTCTKSWGRPHEPCEWCRGRIAIGPTTEHQQALADHDHDNRKPAPATAEYGKYAAWFCDTCGAKADGIGPWIMEHRPQYVVGDKWSWVCGGKCGNGLHTYRPCDRDGREIGAARYFKPPPPDCPGYFYVLLGNRVFMNATGSMTDVTEKLPVKSVVEFREITAAEALALIGAA